MVKYAFANPGRIGDMLYILPTAKFICERDSAVADIYTSEVCRPAEKLVRYQPYVNDFIVPPEYKIEHDGVGIQPWKMPVIGSYDKIYQLGYKDWPTGPLHLFIARQAGLDTVDAPVYSYPEINFYNEPYIVLAHCAHRSSGEMADIYRYFIDNCSIKCVLIGSPRDFIEDTKADNMTHLDMLEMTSLIARAKAFVGFYSAPLVIANGFANLLKVITTWPGAGQEHGLNLKNIINLNYPTKESLLRTVMDNI